MKDVVTFFDFRLALVILFLFVAFELKIFKKIGSFKHYGAFVIGTHAILALLALLFHYIPSFRTEHYLAAESVVVGLGSMGLWANLVLLRKVKETNGGKVERIKKKLMYKLPIFGGLLFYTIQTLWSFISVFDSFIVAHLAVIPFVYKQGGQFLRDYVIFLIFTIVGRLMVLDNGFILDGNFLINRALFVVGIYFLFSAIARMEIERADNDLVGNV